MTKIDKSKAYIKYAFDVLEGKISACVHIKNACKRFIDNFNRDDIYFDYKKADRVISFCQMLKHHDAPPGIVGTPFYLSDWQQWVAINLFAWIRTNDNVRHYTRAYIEVARKNSKTMLMSALAVYSLIEYKSANQILITANSVEQAGRAFDFCCAFCSQIDPKSKSLKKSRNKIKFKETGGFVQILSTDYKSADGYNPYFSIVDEYGSSPTSAGYDSLRSGATKPGALVVVITTAGPSKDCPCYEMRTNAIDVAAGNKTDDRFFCAVYAVDETMDWTSPDVWKMACPNLGIYPSYEFYHDNLNSAKNSISDELNFKIKNLNFWQSANDVWIPDAYVEKVLHPVDLKRYDDALCYMGLDLGSYSDMTAITFSFFDEEYQKLVFYNEYFLPESCLKDNPNKEKYRIYKAKNLLHLTPGNVVDYSYIIDRILTLQKQYQFVIKKIGFDIWNATQLQVDGINAGLHSSLWEPVSQSLSSMNRPTKECDRLIRSNNVIIDANDITRQMFADTVIKQDWNGNMKPNKAVTVGGEMKYRKIDGVISILNALQMHLLHSPRKLIVHSLDDE